MSFFLVLFKFLSSPINLEPTVEVPDGLMTADDGTLVAYRVVPLSPPASR